MRHAIRTMGQPASDKAKATKSRGEAPTCSGCYGDLARRVVGGKKVSHAGDTDRFSWNLERACWRERRIAVLLESICGCDTGQFLLIGARPVFYGRGEKARMARFDVGAGLAVRA